MSVSLQDYLKLLRDVGKQLEQLAMLANQKAAAVHKDDLLGLDDVLKQEQALGLSLRGLELRRQKLVPQLGLEGVALIDLPSKCPPELELEARDTVRELQNRYKIYRSCSDMARNTLELTLHQIDKIVLAAGGDPKDLVAGYVPDELAPPKKMKTDFRA